MSSAAQGAKLVLVLFPELRSVVVHSVSGLIWKLQQDQLLEDRDTLPGFRIPVSATFEGI